jgi:hypothetical protein
VLPVPSFYDDPQTRTKQILSYSTRLSLPKQSPSFDIPAHLRRIDATSQYMLGLRYRVSKGRPVRFIGDVLKAQQVFRVLQHAF